MRDRRGQKQQSFVRINHKIRVAQVRCTGDDGQMLGVMATSEALSRAREVGKDLVEISPNADPPVCRIMDYGQYRYQEGQKRRQFVVAGTEGTIEIRPLEPPQLTLVLDRPRGKFAKGRQQVKLPAMPGRYDDQLRHLARIARGQSKPEYPPAHDLAVQELLLRASNMPVAD